MIKIFEMNGKMNAVDSDNNFVGFDLRDDCCAKGGYFISETICRERFNEQPGNKDVDLSEHNFDVSFFEAIKGVDELSDTGGNAVVFKMRFGYGRDDEAALYLHLYNCHNGYYSKGFKASFREIREGRV